MRERQAHRVVHRCGLAHATAPSAERRAEQRRRFADRHDRAPRAPRAARAARPKSPPLNRPPMITTRPWSKLSIARSAASTLVAFESLTKPTPWIAAHRLERVLEAGEALDGARHRVRARRRRSRRPPPPRRRRSAGGGRAGAPPTAAPAARRRPPRRCAIASAVTTMPSAIAADGLSGTSRARACAPAPPTAASSTLTTAQSSALLVGEDARPWPRRTPRAIACRSR